ncbi:MAG: class I SAM-dependent methyltransferase [Halobacteriaceae archaeon]
MSTPVTEFYGAYAALYDRLARYALGSRRWRAEAVTALDLQPGDTVVDVGCGTGASFPYLRRAVGSQGRVIGIDLTPELLSRARRHAARWSNVAVVHGTATCLPLDTRIDGILGCFVVGLLDDPAAVVETWRRAVGSNGRVALLDGLPTGWAPPLDRMFAALVSAWTPPTARDGVTDRLTRKVAAAHGRLRILGPRSTTASHALGFVRMTAGDGEDPPST